MPAREPVDPLSRDSDLVSVAERLILCQQILDRHGLSLEAAHLDMTLALLRKQVDVPDPSLSHLFEEWGFGLPSDELDAAFQADPLPDGSPEQ